MNLADHQTKLDNLTAAIEQAQSELRERQSELSQARASLTAAERSGQADLSDYTDKVNRLAGIVKNISLNIDRRRQELALADKAFDNLRIRALGMDNEAARLRHQVNNYHTRRIADLERQLEQARAAAVRDEQRLNELIERRQAITDLSTDELKASAAHPLVGSLNRRAVVTQLF